MDASSSFMVLGGRLVVHGLPIRRGKKYWRPPAPGKEWSAIECRSKHAYGCGTHGQGLVSGISLHARLVRHPDDLTTSLSISLTDDAIQSIHSRPSSASPAGSRSRAGYVSRTAGSSSSSSPSSASTTATASTTSSTTPPTPRSTWSPAYPITSRPCTPWCPSPPAPPQPPTAAGVTSSPCWRVSAGPIACTPAARAAAATASGEGGAAAGPWEVKLQRFPEPSQFFSADVVFSSDAKAFWADLSQGVACCDLRAGGGGGSAVDTVFIYLPDEHVIDYPDSPEPSCDCDCDYSGGGSSNPKRKTVEGTRTMGAADEDTVKFVCIDGRPGDETVNVLTLDLRRRRWKEDEGFPCPWIELWKQLVGSMMNAPELREVEPPEPLYPVLMPDGALCLLLANVRGLEEGEDYICSFNMRSKSVQCFGRVRRYDTTGPLILPYDFFTKCYPPPRHRKLPIDADA